MKKLHVLLLSLVLILAVLTGCTAKSASKNEQALKVGVTAGPHEQIVEKVKELAEKQGLKIEIVTFNDYVQPNVQLFDKKIDVNIYQHEPYLNKFNSDKNMNLVKIAPTVNFPMGVYSNKIKSLNELKNGDKIALPNDPTNEARALILLQSANVIKLKDGVGINATLKDVVENPKNIKFVELEAAMVPRSLPDVTAAAINTNYAMEAGLNPVKDSIFIEPKDSPWVNIIAARPDNKDDERIKKLVEIYHSDEVKKFIEETFQGSVIPGF
ncbi:MetQ/NlpA family ABC transporter substrate-binding protein [Fonticella tunisiensis]|uniref:Lipoprotein n=1 Tax=Fonticella tunisiensis TaxID=1096341 RepID=A0A4R7K5X2_9CLOT|nr:MetQ/NlpA family ABC transporter substrate-binding protein [Fonticella tunisiensis]TDT45647.1 D-methionine transport system substrate-binding protein [Fonticella tunisiensis]